MFIVAAFSLVMILMIWNDLTTPQLDKKVRVGPITRITETSSIPFDMITLQNDTESVSAIIRNARGYAPVESAAIEAILRRACASSPPPLVLDVGANLGYFTLLAAAHGCRVRAYEPSITMSNIVRDAVSLNGFNERVTVVNAGVGATAGFLRFAANTNPALSRVVPDDASTAHLPRLPIITLANEITEDVLLIKMDTEGYEAQALQGLLPACGKFRIANIVIEIKKPTQELTLERLWACMDASAIHSHLDVATRGMWFREWYADEEIANFHKNGLTSKTPHGYMKRLQSPWVFGVEDAWFALDSKAAWSDMI